MLPSYLLDQLTKKQNIHNRITKSSQNRYLRNATKSCTINTSSVAKRRVDAILWVGLEISRYQSRGILVSSRLFCPGLQKVRICCKFFSPFSLCTYFEHRKN